MTGNSEEQRVQTAVRRHRWEMDAHWADRARAIVLSDHPHVLRLRAQIQQEEADAGLELSALLQPFQDRREKAERDGDLEVLIGICPGKHSRWGRICALDEGHETSMEAPHWGRNSDGQPVAWVGSAPDDW